MDKSRSDNQTNTVLDDLPKANYRLTARIQRSPDYPSQLCRRSYYQYASYPIVARTLALSRLLTVLGICAGVYLSCVPSIGRGYATVLTSIPPLIGSILINVLPGENKIALLFMYWLSCTSSPFTRTDNVLIQYRLGQHPIHHLPWMGDFACLWAYQTQAPSLVGTTIGTNPSQALQQTLSS